MLPEGRMNFKSILLKIFKLFEFQTFWSSLFHSITAKGKMNFESYYLISISCAVWYVKVLKNTTQFSEPSFFQGFPNLAHCIISL